MRLRLEVDDTLVAAIDEIAGPHGRNSFVRAAIVHAVQQERRWCDIEAAAGSITDSHHGWDDDPAARVRQQQSGDAQRLE